MCNYKMKPQQEIYWSNVKSWFCVLIALRWENCSHQKAWLMPHKVLRWPVIEAYSGSRRMFSERRLYLIQNLHYHYRTTREIVCSFCVGTQCHFSLTKEMIAIHKTHQKQSSHEQALYFWTSKVRAKRTYMHPIHLQVEALESLQLIVRTTVGTFHIKSKLFKTSWRWAMSCPARTGSGMQWESIWLSSSRVHYALRVRYSRKETSKEKTRTTRTATGTGHHQCPGMEPIQKSNDTITVCVIHA